MEEKNSEREREMNTREEKKMSNREIKIVCVPPRTSHVESLHIRILFEEHKISDLDLDSNQW